MGYVLKTTNLSKQFKSKKAVSEINMTINKGDIYGFIGRNGAGKTTLMRMVVGLASPTSGNIELFGSTNLNSERKKIGTIIENPALYLNMTAKQNMIAQAKLIGSDEKEVDELLALFELSNTGKKKIKHFSLGMKQRLAIAIAMLGNPEFLCLDEPVNGLDPTGIKEIRELLIKLNREKGLTILISSHILGELSRLATRYGVIEEGELIEEFTNEELETRCKSHIVIKASDIKKAIEVIENTFNTKNYEIISDNTIHLFDLLDNGGEINTALAKNDIVVESISLSNADLEEYFIKLLGGKHNG